MTSNFSLQIKNIKNWKRPFLLSSFLRGEKNHRKCTVFHKKHTTFSALLPTINKGLTETTQYLGEVNTKLLRPFMLGAQNKKHLILVGSLNISASANHRNKAFEQEAI